MRSNVRKKILGEQTFAKDGVNRGTTLIPETSPALDADNARLRRDLFVVRNMYGE